MQSDSHGSAPLCPSAQPDMRGSAAFGVVGGTVESPRVNYLAEVLPVTDELIFLSEPVNPTEVFRFAAPCAEGACRHFDGSKCRLAARTVQQLPVAVERLPPCAIRPNCRWWRQEGKAACLRCPSIVTEMHLPTDQERQAANPAA